MDLLILGGGSATRMGDLCLDIPKPLLPVGGRPFVSYPIEYIANSLGSCRVLVSARLGDGRVFKKSLPDAIIIEEPHPLGTGGAILNAVHSYKLSDPFLVLNGDVFFEMDAKPLLRAVKTAGAAMAAVQVEDAARFGVLDVNARGFVQNFREKTGNSGAGLINAGLYALTHAALQGFDNKPSSFEVDIAPVLVKNGTLCAVQFSGPFLDIGTPQSYGQAETFLNLHTKHVA